MNRCAIASREHCRPQPKVKIFSERKSKKKEQKPKRRVPVTASIAWPTSIREMDERSKIRWQHRLKREHPTGTERRSLLEECGWKGGDSGLLGARENLCPTKNKKTHLTPTGLLMEGDSAQNLRRGVDECNRDVSPITNQGRFIQGDVVTLSSSSQIPPIQVVPYHSPFVSTESPNACCPLVDRNGSDLVARSGSVRIGATTHQ